MSDYTMKAYSGATRAAGNIPLDREYWRDRAVRAETDLATARNALERLTTVHNGVMARKIAYQAIDELARAALARLTPEEPQ